MDKIELLAPAGSLEALEAAVESGADAIYIGGSKFNARAFAENLDEDMLKKAVEYAHIRGARVYVTVNILILQNELQEVMEYIEYLYSIYVDAVIVQDIGVAMLIKRLLPDFEVHCSTQMAVHNTDGASLLYELGFKRVVLARELSLQEINRIAETGIDAEVFVHGALCVCYSGQCYMSSLIGGRSGNRGKCAQPCRRKYRLFDVNKEEELQPSLGSYLISTRDLNTYENLYDIASSKAASLKIEGRMKRPEYVAIITHNYREALDCIHSGKDQCISEEAAYELKIAFNREFTQGYMFNKRNQEIVSIERPDNRGIYIGRTLNQKGNIVELILEDNFINDGDSIEIISENGKSTGGTISGIKKDNVTIKSAKAGDKIRIFITDRVAPGSIVNKTIDSSLFQKAREVYGFKNKKKIAIKGVFTGSIHQVPILELDDGHGNHVTITGDELIQSAQKLAMSVEKIAEQLNKTKDTPYVFEELEINIEANSFLSVKAINNLRREAIEQLSGKRIQLHQRSKVDLNLKDEIKSLTAAELHNKHAALELIAGVTTLEAGIAAIKGGADALYILGDYRYQEGKMLIDELLKHCDAGKCALYYVLPQITRDIESSEIEAMLQQVAKHSELGLVISNLGHIKLAKRLNITNIRSNFSLNTVNSAAADFLTQQGLQSLCISPELNLSQIKALSNATNAELEAIVYGYLPAMITEYCPRTTAAECNNCSHNNGCSYSLMDEKNKQFRVVNMGNCKNMILNSDVLCAYDYLANIIESGIGKLRLDFYVESGQNVFKILEAYKEKITKPMKHTKSNIIDEIKKGGFTKGHYFRGID